MPIVSRAVAVTALTGLTAWSAFAQTAEPVALPGTCYMLSRKGDKSRLIDRIELQEIMTQPTAGSASVSIRIRIGIAPRGSDDLPPSDLSAPCKQDGKRMICDMRCDETAASHNNGAFRVEPTSKTKDSVRLRIEQPLTLNACTPGETPIALPPSLAGKTFTLRRAGSSDCFH